MSVIKDIEKILRKACEKQVFDLREIDVISYFGSTGGSSSFNFLVKMTNSQFPPFIIKVAPLVYGVWNKKKVVINNSPLVEVDILKVLNKEVLAKGLTPAIPVFLGTQECKDLQKIVGKENCPAQIEDKLGRELCLLKELLMRQQLSPKFQITAMEFGGNPFPGVLANQIPEKHRDYFIVSLLFQITFALAVIQTVFPAFRHNDFGNASNILVRPINEKEWKQFDEYVINKEVSIPLARVYRFVIIDYGLSTIKGTVPTNFEVIKQGSRFGTILNEDPNQKRDLYDLITTILRMREQWSDIRTASNKLISDIVKIEFGNDKNMEQAGIIDLWDIKSSNPVYKALKTPREFLKKFPWDKYLDKYIPNNYSVVSEYHLE